MNKPPGPWLRDWPMQLMFEARQVRPGDFLWLHNSPGYRASKIVIVVEPRWWPSPSPSQYRAIVQVLCDNGSDYGKTNGPGTAFRSYTFRHVKAWCRPPLDIEL